MHRYLARTWVLALCACGENGQFVGDDLGDDYATPKAGMEGTFAMPSDALVATVVDFAATCEPTGVDPHLVVSGAAGAVMVVHEGVERTACADWEVMALADPETMRLSISYVNTTGRPCEPRCDWTFAYTVEGLAAGTWEIQVAGLYTTADVL